MNKRIFWIASYPKSGNTWMRAIVSSLFFTKNGVFNFKLLPLIPTYEKAKIFDFVKKINLNDYRGKLVLINFWATWCIPCKKEMPSLDLLYQKSSFKNLQVFAINIEQPNTLKTKNFFSDLNIKKLEIFFDHNLNFVKELKLRGVPTTVLINKKGEEFARIIGEVNFQDKKLLKWLLKYD